MTVCEKWIAGMPHDGGEVLVNKCYWSNKGECSCWEVVDDGSPEAKECVRVVRMFWSSETLPSYDAKNHLRDTRDEALAALRTLWDVKIQELQIKIQDRRKQQLDMTLEATL